ncbi:protein of unknown function [Taphrina deformans PYCC 5710]|uniref:Uncharacterized protein n=1 Tax=Taphrina deformans (strain PYCC 5710 / ATCC 11124 / CBS 356.35 / IMI 108563 / JCM 9778 / NBRC 8474) TaxID=1097556 RepID=R4X839_TAPDE|nr:protein of unknown function [Taphrina deformans PYCC 5710]|eukprot:CCG81674.1 protein of unknown function [Taphrina deformans PYCC 5710]
MSFQSEASVVIPHPIDKVYSAFSADKQSYAIAKLSPLMREFTITDTDEVLLASDLTYCNHDVDLPASTSEEVARRIHWVLKEQVTYLGIPVSVTVLGTQIHSDKGKLHIYEGSANDGQVVVHKVRRFIAEDGHKTRIAEVIHGRTMWLLSGFVGRECRRAHAKQVARYIELPI